MIITIAGEGGAGKSTVAKLLAKKLGYKHYSTGDLRGEIAKQHGMTIDQLNEIGTKEKWTDEECDSKTVEIGKTQDNIVFDSWMAWHFIPTSFKIFLTVDPHVAAERIFNHQRPDEEKQENIAGMYVMLQERYMNNVQRYKKWYNVDIRDTTNFDLVLDATRVKPEEIVDVILKKLKR